MLAWCGREGLDLTLIETMPLGEVGDRTDQYLPLSLVRARLRQRWTLTETPYRTGGPARYFDVAETGRRLGFITPMTHNFCESCNRVRLTCTGTLFMCLGQDDAADLRRVMRGGADEAGWRRPSARRSRASRAGTISSSTAGARRAAVARTMSLTGGCGDAKSGRSFADRPLFVGA